MNTCTEEKTTLEKHLCFVLGRTVDLRSQELLSLTAGDLKRAYYRRAHEFHPDKAAGLGLDPEYLTDRFRTLQDSYDFLLESLDSGLFTRYVGKREPVILRPRPASSARSGSGSSSGATGFSGARARPGTSSGPRPDFRTRSESSTRSSSGSARSSGGPSSGRAAPQNENAAGSRPFTRGPYASGYSFSSSSRASSGPACTAPALSGWYQGSSIPGFPLRLAQYLYYSRKIDSKTLIQAISWQYRVRPKLGDLAISLGYMTPRDVLFVIRQKQPAELFGETALRLGFLTPYRFSVLMGRQRLLNLPIGRFFVDGGYLSDIELADALAKLNAHNFQVRASAHIAARGCFAR
jgi:hypothetical protein